MVPDANSIFHPIIYLYTYLEIVVPRVSSRHTCQLPMTRVKNIIKSDPEISLTSTEATLIIAKVNYKNSGGMQCVCGHD